MPIIKKPDYNIFASEAKTGEIVDFPNLLRGWGVTLDQTAGKPPMEWFNALQKRTDEWLTYLSQRGLPEWQNTLDYPKDAVVQFGGKFYVAKKNTKNAQPDRSQNDWALFSDALGVSGALLKTSNLADVANKSKARSNLELGTAATKNVGTEGGNVMQVGAFGLGVGPQHRDNAYSNAAQIYRINGTSVSSPGSGVYGVVSLPCDGGPSGSYLAIQANGIAYIGWSNKPENGVAWTQIFTAKNPPTAAGINAADARNNFAARMGVARVLSGSNPPTSPGVWSVENCGWTPEKWGTLLCTTNKANLSTARGEGQFLHYFFLGHSSKLYVAVNVNNTGAGWQQLIGPAGGNLNGPVSSTSWLSAATLTAAYHTTTAGKAPEGGGMFSAQLDSKAAFYQANFDWDVTAGGYYVPLVKGRSNRKGQGYPTAVSFGYLLDGSGSFARPCIHARGDNNKDAVWQFNPNDLMLYAPGGIKAGGATLATDGNIWGSRWGNKWLWDAVIEQVSGRVDWGSYNRDVGARATNDYVNGNFVQNVRLSGRINQADTGGQVRVPDGCVFTGMSGANYNPSIWASYSYVQVLINGTWRNIGTS